MKNTADRLIQWQERHKKTWPLAAALSVVFIVALNIWQNTPRSIAIAPLLFVGLFVCLVYMPVKWERRWLPFLLLGLLTGFFMTVDPLVYSVDGISRRWTLVALPFFVLFSAVSALVFAGLSRMISGFSLRSTAMAQTSKEVWACYSAALLLMWLPAFLSLGPLRISADSYNVIQQALGAYPLNDSHPIAYTLVLRMFLKAGQAVGSLTAGAYLFGAGQMAFLAGVLGYSLVWMRRQGAPRMLAVVGLLYFGLSPVFAINSFTLWKDIPFNATLLLYSLYLYQVANSGGALLMEKKGMLRFVALSLAICFLRGNGFYIVLVCVLAIALIYRRLWRRWLLWFVPLLLAVQLLLGPVYTAFGITRLGGVESAALPLQQVARAVKNGAPLTADQTAVIEQFIPLETLKEVYVSASPDPIKTHPDFDGMAFDKHFAQFMGLWGQLLKTNKQVYLDAWLLQTLGYWKVDFHGWTALTSEYGQDTGIRQLDVLQRLTGTPSRQWFEDRTGFLSLSLMAYIVLFAAAHLLSTRRGEQLLFLLPMLVIWLGLMLGAPAYAEFRYMLLFPLALPALIYIVVAPGASAEI